MIKVLGRNTSGNVQKVLWMLGEAKIGFEREDYGRQFGNTTTDEYRALNPNSKVPTLVDGDTVIWESNSILRFLAATYAKQFDGATPAEQSATGRWMDWVLASVNAPYLVLFKETKKAPAERGADFAPAVTEMDGLLRILDAHLKGKDFLALNKLTIADFSLAPIVKRCAAFPIERKPTPEVDRWLSAFGKRDAFKAVVS
jgi:glutathione S-transferase